MNGYATRLQLLDRGSTLPVPCCRCGHKTHKTIAQLERQPEITCASCGRTIHIDQQEFRSALQRAEYLLHDIGRGLGRQFRSKV